jgi:arylsulfatase
MGKTVGFAVLLTFALVETAPAKDIVHDTEYYILEAQNAEKWAEDDKVVDRKLAEFREKNGGKPPNIVYILIDDIGFGDLGIPELNAVRGYRTPNINEFAREGMRFVRMYTEPSCTPTRVAFMTGRQPHRNGMGDTAVDIAGFGLAEKEVTLAEVLSEAGYNTSHIGKWHMGDIEESWPHNQGFDYAAFPVHQQGQLTIFHDDAAREEVSVSIGPLAGKDEPFFLQYWPLYPLTGPRTAYDEYTTPNGGTYVEKMQLIDQWIGDIMKEMDELGVADNTVMVIMGDNGHFTKYSPQSGFSAMIYKGGKGDYTEGGVRVDAFVRWPGMIEKYAMVNDIVHVSDLFTSLARLGGATDEIPTDRIIDGVDQTALMLEGETHGRRDYVFIYSGNKMEAVVKEHLKLKVPGPGENPIVAKFYHLFRDTREEYPVATEVGAWGGAEFVRVVMRHKKRMQKYPSEPPAYGVPYEGITNLRPETKAAVEAFMFKQAAAGK